MNAEQIKTEPCYNLDCLRPADAAIHDASSAEYRHDDQEFCGVCHHSGRDCVCVDCPCKRTVMADGSAHTVTLESQYVLGLQAIEGRAKVAFGVWDRRAMDGAESAKPVAQALESVLCGN